MANSQVSFSDGVSVAPDVLFRLVSDEAVLVNLNTEVYLGLNPVGARIWTVLCDSASIQSAFDRLQTEYDVEPAELSRDLAEFIAELVRHQLIETRPARA
ncbi:MAG TPA: PqqD family protein [Vicinamibacterales bacterium]|jgi:hypothetical protein|nr:PqqD family protein [Vicinamibacterales bacterium]